MTLNLRHLKKDIFLSADQDKYVQHQDNNKLIIGEHATSSIIIFMFWALNKSIIPLS